MRDRGEGLEEGNDNFSYSFLKGNFDVCVEEDGSEKVPYRKKSSGPQHNTWEFMRNTDSQFLPQTY